MADFQKWSSRFQAEGVGLVAGSTDPLESSRKTVENIGITFPVAHGLDATWISEITGAFFDRNRNVLHSAGFLVRPDQTIDVACYSTGPVGRFAAKEIYGLILYYKKQKADLLRTISEPA